MALTEAAREQVRSRANFACEFCGVRETDVGGELTVDHYRPRSEGGGDDLANLIYSCHCCNLYKSDYWPRGESKLHLCNPRLEQFSEHFLECDDGSLRSLTERGEFTLHRLRLNRPQLVAHRSSQRRGASRDLQLTILGSLSDVLEQLLQQQTMMTREQHRLLEELQQLLWFLLHRK